MAWHRSFLTTSTKEMQKLDRALLSRRWMEKEKKCTTEIIRHITSGGIVPTPLSGPFQILPFAVLAANSAASAISKMWLSAYALTVFYMNMSN